MATSKIKSSNATTEELVSGSAWIIRKDNLRILTLDNYRKGTNLVLASGDRPKAHQVGTMIKNYSGHYIAFALIGVETDGALTFVHTTAYNNSSVGWSSADSNDLFTGQVSWTV